MPDITPWSYPRSKNPWQQHARSRYKSVWEIIVNGCRRNVPVIAQTRYFPLSGAIHILGVVVSVGSPRGLPRVRGNVPRLYMRYA